MSECEICAESFTVSAIRQKIICPSCDHEACSSCVRRFLLENTIQPQCMACRAPWTIEFVREHLPRSFLDSTYRTHQQGVILARATATLPDLQEVVERRARIDRVRTEIAEVSTAIRQLRITLGDLQDQLRRLQRGGDNIENPIGDGGAEILDQVVENEADTPRSTTIPCPDATCRGFLSTVNRCGLCHQWFCGQCHGRKGERRDAPHECNEDDRATLRLLRENTRPCPNCRMGIFKVSGCDQMWCTQCQTAFSWRTGKALRGGVIHNPHYYDYMRNHRQGDAPPRNPLDIPCGGIPTANHLLRHLYRGIRIMPWMRRIEDMPVGDHPMDQVEAKELETSHRLLTHVETLSLPSLNRVLESRQVHETDVGVRYLTNKIDKNQWVAQLYIIDRRQEKTRRLMELYTMFTTTGGDIFRNFIGQPFSPETMTQTLVELRALVAYVNRQLDVLRKQYQCVLPTLRTQMVDLSRV